MGLESATYISQLVTTNPVGATDPKSQGDDHLRLLKLVLQAQFPSLGAAAVTVTAAQINTVIASGITGFANSSATVGPTAVNGVALTAARSDSAPAINLTANYTWTGTHAYATGKFSINGVFFNGLANSSVTAGLTAKNGTALTGMRSDGAPAIDQTIAPTWSAQHIYSKSGSTKANCAVLIGSNVPSLVMNDADGATDHKQFERVIDTGVLTERTLDDSSGTVVIWQAVPHTTGIPNYPQGLATNNLIVGTRRMVLANKTADYSIVKADIGNTVRATTNTGIDFTFPSAGTGGFESGDSVLILNESPGTVSLAAGAGTALYWYNGTTGGTATPASRTMAISGFALLWFDGSNWYVMGGVGLS